MRFSAALQQIARLGQVPARSPVEPVRATERPQPQEAAPTVPLELPLDLDQRVRLIGEW